MLIDLNFIAIFYLIILISYYFKCYFGNFMRAIIQRVTEASVKIDEKINGQIGVGLMILLGVEIRDTKADAEWLTQKIANMRIFSDEQGLMNKSLNDVDGNILLISQFTLFAATKKGNRPGFTRSAKPELAIPMYEHFIKLLEEHIGKQIQTGAFGADMKVTLVNDGPITIIMDTQDKDNF
jgi:D-tyrosyl-tRNA(Tyr) deacylase